MKKKPIYHAYVYNNEVMNVSLPIVEKVVSEEFNDGKPLGFYKTYYPNDVPMHLRDDVDRPFEMYKKVLIYIDNNLIIGILK